MKINLAIDCIDDQALSTSITLYSFLEKNKWFNGKVYIIIPNNSSLTQNARANLTSIYSNLEVINCSANSAFRNHILNHKSDLLAIQKILAASSLFIAEERMLFVSSGCVFFKAISSILNSDPISLSTDSSGNIAGEIFYRKIIISDTLVTDTKLVEFFSSKEDISKILSSEFNVNSTAVFGEKSSRFSDRVFMKMKSSISSLYFIKYDTLQKDARQFTKINQIFLQNKNQVTNKLKKPIFRNGKTLIKSDNTINSPLSKRSPNQSNRKIEEIKNDQRCEIQKKELNRRSASSNQTRKLTKSEIFKLKQSNSKFDCIYKINQGKLKSIATDSTLANMTNYEALKTFTVSSTKKIIELLPNSVISLSVILPYFRAGDIGWVPFEAMIRQENIDFNWEIVIIEEDFENPFELDRILNYSDQLSKVGCAKITYISLRKWIPLSAKWYFLINECSDTSKVVAMNSSDIYFSKLRLSKQYYALTSSNKNWYKLGGNLVYDLGLDFHVKLTSMDPRRTDTCAAAARMDLMKKLPLACIKVNVDSWRYNTLNQATINFYYDNSQDLQLDTVNINGLNNLSLGRSEKIKKVSHPFKECCGSLKNHIPLEVFNKLRESAQYLNSHKSSRDSSNIKLR
jgi:hypothetical protein